MIFEILNAKGKELASVDLIKNAIFERLDDEVPADTAKETWLQIRNNLCSRSLRIEFASFYRHFWISHYGKVQDNKLYSDFLKKVQKSDESYLNFLKELDASSRLYAILLKPNIELDFYNKKEYAFIITEFNAINNVFGVVQIRPVLLSLLDLHLTRKSLQYRLFKRIIKTLSCFHFVYNAICSRRTSSLETPLNDFAYNIFQAKTSSDINQTVTQLKSDLINLLPTEEEFVENFVQLKYSKLNISSNVLTKFAVNYWHCMSDNSDVFLSDSSIEHIKDEVETNETTKLIGNLLLLEQRINSNIPNNLSFERKKTYYEKSNYSDVRQFISQTSNLKKWDEDEIQERSKNWAKEYYKKILKTIRDTI